MKFNKKADAVLLNDFTTQAVIWLVFFILVLGLAYVIYNNAH